MTRGYRRLLLLLLCFACVSPWAHADPGLFDWGFNVNGGIYWNPGLTPAFFNTAGFDFTTGLGTITITFQPGGAGAYSVVSFIDHEFDAAINTYFNEFGQANGSPAAGQTWEIDEPGYALVGDIYDNVLAGALDNTGITGPEDISMALGWNMILAEDEIATINMMLSLTPPAGGFYLAQWDPESTGNNAVYFSSNVSITGGGTNVPEPATFTLLGLGIVALAVRRRRVRA